MPARGRGGQSWGRGGRVLWRRGCRVVRSSSRWRRTAPANSGQRGATAHKLQYARGVRMGIRTYRCVHHEHRMEPCGLWSSELASRAARSVFARCLRSLVAVKLVQKGDEPLGTTNKVVDSGTHGSWSMCCQQMREPCSAVVGNELEVPGLACQPCRAAGTRINGALFHIQTTLKNKAQPTYAARRRRYA